MSVKQSAGLTVASPASQQFAVYSSLFPALIAALIGAGCGSSRAPESKPAASQSAEAPLAQAPTASQGPPAASSSQPSTTETTPVNPTPPPTATPSELKSLAKSNAFGTNLYAELNKQPGNLVFSPASIHIALGMAYAGARGATAKEMQGALQAGASDEALHRVYGAALHTWNETQSVKLRVANRIYVDKNVPLEASYSSLTEQFYRAPAERVDFVSAFEPARLNINSWVEKQTEQKIKDLLPQGSLTSLTRLVLTNAVYFKGSWATQFNPQLTHKKPFWVEGKTSKNVDSMSMKGRFAWAKLPDGLRILEMPYTGGELSMVWLLPETREGLKALEAKLTAESLEKWRKSARQTEVEVQIPKFRLEPPSMALSKALGALGIRRAFAENAEFEGIAQLKTGLYISDVFHKAFIEVNEEGTEAAAATGVVMATRGLPMKPPPEPPRFIAEHPFLFALMDQRTGAILFLGRLVDPA